MTRCSRKKRPEVSCGRCFPPTLNDICPGTYDSLSQDLHDPIDHDAEVNQILRDHIKPTQRSFAGLLEIPQIGRRLILLGGHQKSVRAQVVVFLADGAGDEDRPGLADIGRLETLQCSRVGCHQPTLRLSFDYFVSTQQT